MRTQNKSAAIYLLRVTKVAGDDGLKVLKVALALPAPSNLSSSSTPLRIVVLCCGAGAGRFTRHLPMRPMHACARLYFMHARNESVRLGCIEMRAPPSLCSPLSLSLRYFPANFSYPSDASCLSRSLSPNVLLLQGDGSNPPSLLPSPLPKITRERSGPLQPSNYKVLQIRVSFFPCN
jgi:hypothetical protein